MQATEAIKSVVQAIINILYGFDIYWQGTSSP